MLTIPDGVAGPSLPGAAQVWPYAEAQPSQASMSASRYFRSFNKQGMRWWASGNLYVTESIVPAKFQISRAAAQRLACFVSKITKIGDSKKWPDVIVHERTIGGQWRSRPLAFQTVRASRANRVWFLPRPAGLRLTPRQVGVHVGCERAWLQEPSRLAPRQSWLSLS